jgi:two-component system NarL family response regulator
VTKVSRPLRILCVDDHAIVREGVATVLNKHHDMRVTAFAANAREAIAQYRRSRPDVVLMDLQLPGMSGFEAIRTIREDDPQACIIVLTMYTGDVDIQRALKAGAAAYLIKDTLANNLVGTIRKVAASAATGDRELSRDSTSATSALSPREEDVLRLIATGMRNKEIGRELGLSEGTIEAHVKKIFAKLQVHDRTAAMAIALRRGILHID